MLIHALPCPLVIRHGSFDLPDDAQWRPVLEAARPSLKAALPAVGRLECPELGALSQCGTAWLVAPDIAVTNRHTILSCLAGLNRGSKTLRIDFCAELNATVDRRVAVRRVLYVAPDLDLAFLQVAGLRAGRAGIPLADRIVVDHPIAAIGFPSDESGGYPAEIFQLCFKDGFDREGQGVKRVSLGHVEAVTGSTLEHDCTTLGGSSGGAILDLVTGQAIGLDFGTADTLDRSRPSNLGIPAWIVRERLERLDR